MIEFAEMPTGSGSLSWRGQLVGVMTALGLLTATTPTVATAEPAAVPEAPVDAKAKPAADAAQPAAKGPAAGSSDASDPGDAPSTRAAILPLVVEGEGLPEADQQTLAGRLVEGLERGDFDVVPPRDVAAASAGAATCKEADCYRAVASATEATHVVRAVIKVDDNSYETRVVLVDGATGNELATSQDSCQICGLREVGDLLDAAAATLRSKLDALAQGPATLQVSSTPVDAQVSIDGELKGTTPFDAPVLPGKHVLRVSKEGFITIEREVIFVEGIEEKISFELEKVPSRLPARPYGWGAIGLGAAALGTAVAFAVLDDRPYELGGACDQRDEQGNCPRLWDADWIVLGTAAAGAGLVTLGVAILLSSARRRGKKGEAKVEATARRPRPRVGIGLGRVSIQGRF